jgi:membrane-associated phospholipid phosphatase
MVDQFNVPLASGWITDLNARMVLEGSNRIDAFPSLHCAVSAYILFFDRVHRPWRFALYATPCVGLWLSTIYLRYHYFIDVIGGFALAALALRVAFTLEYRKNKRPLFIDKKSTAGRVSCQARQSSSWDRGIFGPFIGQRRQVSGRFGVSRE